MSYVIAKSISVRKDKTTMVSRSSNVWPADYYSSTFPTNNAELLREFDSGCIQPTDSANGYKWWWILSELDKSGLQGEERLNRFKTSWTPNVASCISTHLPVGGTVRAMERWRSGTITTTLATLHRNCQTTTQKS